MSELLKVHVGCGPRLLLGWVNIDIDFGDVNLSAQDPEAKFLRTDVTVSMPFHDATIDAIYSEDFFEHLDQRGQFYFLSECLRVLKPMAYCRISTPSLFHSFGISSFSGGRSGVGDPWAWGHKLIVSSVYMEHLACFVGFDYNRSQKNQSACHLMPEDVRPNDGAPDHTNLFTDLRKMI